MPASKSAMAKMVAAFEPNNGCNKACACESSSTIVPLLKNVVAAKRIIALLIAHPITIENNVSKNSYFKAFLMRASPLRWIARLWITSECKKRLCGITTAPSTLMIIKSDPCGTEGTVQPTIAAGQSIFTKNNS